MTPDECPSRVHTYSAYSNGRCKCDEGRAAKAAYMSRRRKAASRKRRNGYVAPISTHGTRAGYEEHGCSCGPCTQAHRDSRPKHRRR